MAQVITDTIKTRTRPASRTGSKGGARKLRAEGWIPAVVYGPGAQEQPLCVPAEGLMATLQKFGHGHIYRVELEGGKPFRALIKDIQQNYISDELLHLDLYAVDPKQPVRLEIPLHLVGKAKGEVEGGIVTQTRHYIEISALPDDVPQELSLDISELDVGDALHLSDIPLPKGVELQTGANATVVRVASPTEAAEAAAPPEGEAAPEGETPEEPPAAG